MIANSTVCHYSESYLSFLSSCPAPIRFQFSKLLAVEFDDQSQYSTVVVAAI